MKRKRILWAPLLVVAVVAAVAAPASAAPSLSVDLSHSPESVPRNFEQVSYFVDVANTAQPSDGSVAVGAQLNCAKTNWAPAGAPPVLSFEWRRNGAPIIGAADSSYSVIAADEGANLQCIVIGTNANARTKFAGLNPVVVLPKPAVAAPFSDNPKEAASRPTIAGTGVANRVCTPPQNWTPRAPEIPATTYTFQWLRNGDPIVGAESNEYLPVAEDSGKILQCEVKGSTAGGVTVGISNNSAVGTVSQPPNNTVANTPFILDPGATLGEVTVEIELPTGEETRAFTILNPLDAGETNPPVGWGCAKTEPSPTAPAKVTCTREDSLAPQASYPGIRVVASVGADAPEPLEATATVSGGSSVSDSDSDQMTWEPALPFAIDSFEANAEDESEVEYLQAGGHPFAAKASFSLQNEYLRADASGAIGRTEAIEYLRSVLVDLPPGFLGNPESISEPCPSVESMLKNTVADPLCPPSSIVGGIEVETTGGPFWSPIYLLEPESGVPAQFGFVFKNARAVYTLRPRLRPADNYAISVEAPSAPKQPPLVSGNVTLCSYGGNISEFLGEELKLDSCKKSGDPGSNVKPFLTNSTECSGLPPKTSMHVDTWGNQGRRKADESPDLSDPNWHSIVSETSPLEGCEQVPFQPSIELRPTSQEADSPTGLDVSISVPTDGLESATDLSQGALKQAIVTLPVGMSVNPAAANGLRACGSTEIKLGTNDPIECPESSKVGSAQVKTPLLEEELGGSIYLAAQGDNPFKSLLALYLVIESKERGLLVKIPGRIEVRPDGQLISTFDDNPQVPFSKLELHFTAGNRAALINPPACGTYEIGAQLSPWSAQDADNPTAAEVRQSTSSFAITSGPEGKPCPAGGLSPRFDAGLRNPVAGSSSPFTLSLSREDGTQRFSRLDLAMPPGLVADLRGIPYCPDAALAAVSGAEGTGVNEVRSPTCPLASQIGRVSVGAGAGANPFFVDTGRAYLAGPYKGAPLSVAIITPAVAGPFDLGSVVVRSGIHVDPKTTKISVKSDPIPTILHGIPLNVRDIRVDLDRQQFTRAPTSCAPMALDGLVEGAAGGSAAVSSRFQVGECAALGFKPNVRLKLKGGTKRDRYQQLTAIVTARPGDANIARASVNFPPAIFLAQEHIQTICTRVQFAAEACPKASIYGFAEAITPLLDQPLKGPVYLRSSDNLLPDLVAALQGPTHQPIEVELSGRTDSKNRGLRNTFDVVPDAPVSRFTLRMQGGKKSLLVTSQNLCRQKLRSTVRMKGQNGKLRNFRPVLKTSCRKRQANSRRSGSARS